MRPLHIGSPCDRVLSTQLGSQELDPDSRFSTQIGADVSSTNQLHNKLDLKPHPRFAKGESIAYE